MTIVLVHPIQFSVPNKHHKYSEKRINPKIHSFRISCSSHSQNTDAIKDTKLRTASKADGLFDQLLLNLFRQKMVQEIGWDSEKPGYDGLIEVANRLILGRSNSEAKDSAVSILRSLFPPLLLDLYRNLITPLNGGKVSAMMVARVTALSCQWLMGPCKVNSVELADGKSLTSGVLVEKCKYLEESRCIGICINTCKLPTQEFFREYMGVPLLMEPNFSDYSCQFKFGVAPLEPQHDSALREPCLEICPNASRRREISILNNLPFKCPKS